MIADVGLSLHSQIYKPFQASTPKQDQARRPQDHTSHSFLPAGFLYFPIWQLGMLEVPFGVIIVTTSHPSRKTGKRLMVLAGLPARRETGEQLP